MEDKDIINLFWERDPSAIYETDAKYGQYCKAIAKNILGNSEDADECVNDTYLKAWNSIPPSRPTVLSTYLGKITRNLSFDRFRRSRADKRGSGEIELVLDELAECVSGTENVEQAFEQKELIRIINSFLDTLPQNKQAIFLCRYYYAMPVAKIAARFGLTAGSVSVTLNRMRGKLKSYLKERGYEL